MLIEQSDTSWLADRRAGPPVAVKVAWSVKQTLAGFEDSRGTRARLARIVRFVTGRGKREFRGAKSPSVRPPFPRPLRRGNYVFTGCPCAVLCHRIFWRHDLSSINGTRQRSGRFACLIELHTIHSVNHDAHPLRGRPSDQCAPLRTHVAFSRSSSFVHSPLPEGRQVPASCSCSPRMSIGKVACCTVQHQAKSTMQCMPHRDIYISPPAKVYLIIADSVVVSPLARSCPSHLPFLAL